MHHSTNRTLIARNKGAGETILSIEENQRNRHTYILGQTGTGKSTLLRNLITADIEAGRGVGFLDPHGSEAEAILNCIPAKRIRHTIYFNPQDTEFPIPFNVLADVPEEKHHLVADSVVGSLRNIWSDSWGPRMEYILLNSIMTLIEARHHSLKDIRPLLTDEEFRETVLRRVTDPEILSFWRSEFDRYPPRFREEAIAPILNKIGQLMISPPLRATLGSKKRSLDMRRMMDSQQIFIANLSKGGLGDSKSGLLGSFLISAFQQAAMQRPTKEQAQKRGLPEPPPFTLYIDEFQSFETDEFVNILSEARKYGLRLVLAHQFSSQLRQPIRDAIFGNVGSIISFRVGSEDAAILSAEFNREYPPSRFTDLANFNVATKLASDDGVSTSRIGATFPPTDSYHGHAASIIKLCRERFGKKN